MECRAGNIICEEGFKSEVQQERETPKQEGTLRLF